VFLEQFKWFTSINLALHPSGVAKSSTSFNWPGKGGNVTSAVGQVTLYDPIWHVSSCGVEDGCILLSV